MKTRINPRILSENNFTVFNLISQIYLFIFLGFKVILQLTAGDSDFED